eukprot:s758_g18.t1
MLHNVLLRRSNRENDDGDDSDASDAETRSDMMRRYADATQSEVSDPDLWAVIHYGEGFPGVGVVLSRSLGFPVLPAAAVVALSLGRRCNPRHDLERRLLIKTCMIS